MRRLSFGALVAVGLIGPAAAHHSFAVHYVGEETVTITGTVTEFRFRNPHGIIFVDVPGEGGNITEWIIETNSPSVLRRRGWSPDSIESGEHVTIVGFPARDGSNAMRVYRVDFDDGRELIGQRPAVGIEQ